MNFIARWRRRRALYREAAALEREAERVERSLLQGITEHGGLYAGIAAAIAAVAIEVHTRPEKQGRVSGWLVNEPGQLEARDLRDRAKRLREQARNSLNPL